MLKPIEFPPTLFYFLQLLNTTIMILATEKQYIVTHVMICSPDIGFSIGSFLTSGEAELISPSKMSLNNGLHVSASALYFPLTNLT